MGGAARERHPENRGARTRLPIVCGVVIVSAPAKINLFLAVTGRRPDGFHDLVSLVAPLEWGDTLTVTGGGSSGGTQADSPPSLRLESDDPGVPTDGTNLVLVAARAFIQAAGPVGDVGFSLQKRIPSGAGLGGGSSDAAAALRALNRLAGGVLAEEALAAVAATVGSDCPLFLRPGPVVMRGRGERVAAVPAAAAQRLGGRRLLVVKPGFGIATPWAYGRLAAGAPATYLPVEQAEARLSDWLDRADLPAEAVAFNSFEPVVFAKFAAWPVLRERIRHEFGLGLHLSGSGSAGFILLPPDADAAPVAAAVRSAWGPSALAVETRITASSA